ncbi:MAG: hypothetical protein QOK25_492, partial [Thermoleophilaceae bacterium]|nr:hypothetical protein [Thermoleophilaceae bacterium]
MSCGATRGLSWNGRERGPSAMTEHEMTDRKRWIALYV